MEKDQKSQNKRKFHIKTMEFLYFHHCFCPHNIERKTRRIEVDVTLYSYNWQYPSHFTARLTIYPKTTLNWNKLCISPLYLDFRLRGVMFLRLSNLTLKYQGELYFEERCTCTCRFDC